MSFGVQTEKTKVKVNGGRNYPIWGNQEVSRAFQGKERIFPSLTWKMAQEMLLKEGLRLPLAQCLLQFLLHNLSVRSTGATLPFLDLP